MYENLLSLPIGERLQAFEDHARDSQSSDDEPIDLYEFYKKRHQEPESEADLQEPEPEATQISDNELADAALAAISDDSEDESVSGPSAGPSAGPSTGPSITAGARARNLIDSDSEEELTNIPSDAPNDVARADADADAALRAEIYAEAGLSPPGSPDRIVSQVMPRKATKKTLELADQDTARRRRNLDLAIGTHTIATATVGSFLENFEAAPAVAKSHAASNKPALEAKLPVYLPDSDDDELEILGSSPPTSPLSRPRGLLSSSPVGSMRRRQRADRGPKSSAQVRNLFATLVEKQRVQAVRNREARVEELKARGIDIVSEDQRAKEAEVVEDLLEQERQRNEELRKLEKHEHERDSIVDFDDSDSDVPSHQQEPEVDMAGSESDSADESDDEELDDSEEEGQDVSRSTGIGRKLFVSDSDDDEPEPSPTLALPARAAPEATQVLPRIDPAVLAKLRNGRMAPSSQPLVEAPSQEDSEPDTLPTNVELPQLASMESDSSDNENVNDALAQLRREAPDLHDLANSSMSASQQRQEARDRYLKAHDNSAAANNWVDDQAEESDDEWAGLGGASDDDAAEDETPVEGLLDDAQVDVGAKQLQQFHHQEELERDEKLVRQLVDDVHGGWRRRRAGHGLLDGLSDSESDDGGEARRKVRDSKKRAKMLENGDMAKLAEDTKTKAFVETLAADLVVRPRVEIISKAPSASIQDSLRFLDDETSEIADTVPTRAPTAADRVTPAQLKISTRSARDSMIRAAAAATSSVKRRAVTAHEENYNSKAAPLMVQAPKKRKARALVAAQPNVAPPAPGKQLGGALFKRNWS